MNAEHIVVSYGDLDPDVYGLAHEAEAVGWDIETSGLDWSRDQIATCQVATPEAINIVIIIADHTPQKLPALLEDDTTRKVFHHAPFDLRFLAHHWHVTPRNVACTKIASKIIDPGLEHAAHSLKPVLERHLGITISKDEQRSDWLADRLRHEQLAYAAADVAHLLSLYHHLGELADKWQVADLILESWKYLPTRVALDLRGPGDVFAY
jgi:ribonuclease D